MNKALLSLAIAAALPTSALAAGPIDGTIYGKVNVSAVNADNSTDDAWKLNSNASRVGVKGKTELAEGIYAIYKAEFEVHVDDGDKNGDTFSQRNIYLGLTGDFGTVLAGKHDTALKLAQKKVDLFNDLEGDIKTLMPGETRASNILNYTSPKFADMLSVSFGTVLGEQAGDSEQDGLFDSYSTAVNFEQGGLYLALAADQNVKSGSFEKVHVDILRGVAQYKVGGLQLGALVQTAENGDSSATAYEADSWFVSAKYTLGAYALKAQYGVTDANAAGVQQDVDSWSLGLDYKLAKSTKVFGFYTSRNNDVALSAADEDNYFGLGMEHKF